MSDVLSGRYNLPLILQRVEILNDSANRSIQEIVRRGQLRVNVEEAFRKPEDLVRLIASICVLKLYAENAAINHGERLDLSTWNGFFEEFSKGTHQMSSGLPS